MKNFPRQKIYNYWALATVGILLFSLAGCNSDDTQKLDQKKYELVWSDEFDGTAGTAPDASKWSYDIGNNSGWGNQELENYTDSPESIALDGTGNLVISAKKNGNSYTSARVKTKALFEQTYGRYEARIKTPYGPGIWPAFWMLGANVDTNPWPKCGEIDIMELRGQQPNIINGTIHGPGYFGGSAITASHALYGDRYDVDYHIFAVEWDVDTINFYVDDYLYKSITKSEVSKRGEWVYDHSFFLILNLAVGGNYVGFPTEQTPFPQNMSIDYVRVYKEVK